MPRSHVARCQTLLRPRTEERVDTRPVHQTSSLMEPAPVVANAVMAKHDADTQHLLNIALATNKRYTTHPGRILDDGFRVSLVERHFKSFRRPNPVSKHDDYLVLGLITTTLDEIGYALYSDTSQASRSTLSFLYGSEVVDGGIFHTHAVKTPSDPYRFLGIKHTLHHLLSPVIFKPREAVYVESMGSTVVDGQPALYMIHKSVDLPEYLGAPGCVRMDVQVVHLFVAPPSGHVHYFLTMLSDLNGNFPSWMANQRSTKLYEFMMMLNQLAQIRRLVAAPAVAPTTVVAPKSRQKCCVCPTVTKKWRWCRTCGEITCTACTFHISKPGHLVRMPPTRSASTASSSAYANPRRTSAAPSGASKSGAYHVKEDYCKKCFLKARHPQAFQTLNENDLSGEFADFVQDEGTRQTPSRSTRERSSGATHAQLSAFSKYNAESGDVYTPIASTASSTTSSKGFRTPQATASRNTTRTPNGTATTKYFRTPKATSSRVVLQADVSTPRLLTLERTASAVQPHRHATTADANDKGDVSAEFNPNLFESLEYQRKLLADMQALLVSANSSPRQTTSPTA
ncbi:hypothetical protein, variant [Aphanomyces invadans]|uniref:START domain-containing protein n=1 Tax=Aphanomyces invadans TaxID=157072 RepID=A0A024USU3_9STRA|nr:hypothetical protein, variant [Aphanomyces invadans]ETW08743.1 hypothetical protein, variant [Aphanomyces invadans]|eukprot:XP_008862548.1 hypothetical protein, variant [Aphanomyces invadans]